MARDIEIALSEARRMVDIITTPTSDVFEEVRNKLASDKVDYVLRCPCDITST